MELWRRGCVANEVFAASQCSPSSLVTMLTLLDLSFSVHASHTLPPKRVTAGLCLLEKGSSLRSVKAAPSALFIETMRPDALSVKKSRQIAPSANSAGPSSLEAPARTVRAPKVTPSSLDVATATRPSVSVHARITLPPNAQSEGATFVCPSTGTGSDQETPSSVRDTLT